VERNERIDAVEVHRNKIRAERFYVGTAALVCPLSVARRFWLATECARVDYPSKVSENT
jgi:hypothetical protein